MVEPYIPPTVIILGEGRQVVKHVKTVGGAVFNIEAGKSLKIETSPSGEEKLNITVPAGKSWEVSMTIHIVETDV